MNACSITRKLILVAILSSACALPAHANFPVPQPQVNNTINLNLTVGAPGSLPIGYDPLLLGGPRTDLAYEGPLAALGDARPPIVVAANQGAVNVTGTVITNPVLGQLQIYCKTDNYTSPCNTYNFTAPAGATTLYTCPYEIVIDPPPPSGPPNYPTDQWQVLDGLSEDLVSFNPLFPPTGANGQSQAMSRAAYVQPIENKNVVPFAVLASNNNSFNTLPLPGPPGTATVGDTCPNGQPSACPPNQAPGLPVPNYGNTPIRFCVDVSFVVPGNVPQQTYGPIPVQYLLKY